MPGERVLQSEFKASIFEPVQQLYQLRHGAPACGQMAWHQFHQKYWTVPSYGLNKSLHHLAFKSLNIDLDQSRPFPGQRFVARPDLRANMVGDEIGIGQRAEGSFP